MSLLINFQRNPSDECVGVKDKIAVGSEDGGFAEFCSCWKQEIKDKSMDKKLE